MESESGALRAAAQTSESPTPQPAKVQRDPWCRQEFPSAPTAATASPMSHPLLSEKNLRHFISLSHEWRPEHDQYWNVALTRQVVQALRGLEGVEIHAEPTHYGSGGASYRDVFIYKSSDARDLSATVELNSNVEVPGIALYLCELAPIATWSGQHRAFRVSAAPVGAPHCLEISSFGFLLPSPLLQPPAGDWESIIAGIEGILRRNGFAVLGSAELDKPLPFTAEIGTLLPEYTPGRSADRFLIFDAVFYWED